MKRMTILLVAAVLGFATAASGATLTVVSDQATYNVGDTITLTITGDSQGASTTQIIGTLLWDGSLTSTVSANQNTLTAFGGLFPWTPGVLTLADGQATVFNQLAGTNPLPADQLLVATLTLTADAVGVVNMDWANTLDFFGIATPHPGTSFEIVGVVPEPGTLLLLGAGLSGLAFVGRRRQS